MPAEQRNMAKYPAATEGVEATTLFVSGRLRIKVLRSNEFWK